MATLELDGTLIAEKDNNNKIISHVDQLSEATSGGGIKLNNSLKTSTGTDIITSTGSVSPQGNFVLPSVTTESNLNTSDTEGSISYVNENGGNLFFKKSSGWSSFTSERGTIGNPASSATELKALGFSDGVYYVRIGTEVVKSYVITRYSECGYIKFASWYDGTNLNNSNAINENGSWIESEVNANAGKLKNTQINTIITSTNSKNHLFRVGGGTDNLLNNGSGTGKLYIPGGLPSWGSVTDLNTSYEFWLDTTSNGTFDYGVSYTSDTRSLCTHSLSTKIWHSDHNYNGSAIVAPPWSSFAICHSVGDTYFATNLHWMSGLSSGSGGEIFWGNNSSSYCSFFLEY